MLRKFSLIVLFISVIASSEEARAKCTKRVADPLITSRFQECNPKEMLSYLYNDLVTPYSFNCAKKISKTCRQENCSEPATMEEEHRCQARYVQVLNECLNELDGAAKMARCKDTKTWPLELEAASRGNRPSPQVLRATQSARSHR